MVSVLPTSHCNSAESFQVIVITSHTMTEKYTGKLHHMKEVARSRWDEVKEQGGPKEVVRSSFIRRVNAGESYDHHYRRKSR